MRLVVFMLFLLSNIAYADLSITTYNIRNFGKKNSKTNLSELARILKNLNADIIGVQEIVRPKQMKAFIDKNLKRYAFVASKCGGSGGQRLGYIFNKNRFKLNKLVEDMRLSEMHIACRNLRPALIAYFENKASGEQTIVINSHLKAGSGSRNFERRARQYRLFGTIISELEQKGHERIIGLGDFNTTGYIKENRDYVNFQQMLSRTDFQSAARDLKCTSYWSGRNRNDNMEEASILDHIIFPKRMMKYDKFNAKVGTHCKKVQCKGTSAEALGISYKEVSDHCPVTLTLK